MKKELLTSGIFLFLGVLIGKATGFIREVIIANKFGVTETADIVVFMFAIPDFLIGLLAAGSLSYTLIPEFKSLSDEKKNALFIQLTLFFLIIFSFFSCLSFIFSEELIYLLAPGLTKAGNIKTASVVKLTFLSIPFSLIVGITTAYLQSNNQFFMTSIATPIINICAIVGLIIIPNEYEKLYILVYFLILGSLLRWISQLILIPKKAFRFSNFKNNLISRELIKRYIMVGIAGYFSCFMPQILRSFASYGDEGSVALLNYAQKMIDFPLGLCLMTLSVLLFPRFAEYFMHNDKQNYQYGTNLLKESVLLIILIAIALTCVMGVFSLDISIWAFGKGNVSFGDLEKIAYLIQIGLLALPFVGLYWHLNAVFNATKDSKTPLFLSIIYLVAIFVTGYTFLKFFKLNGLMLSYTVSSIITFSIQTYLLRKKHKINIIDFNFFKKIVTTSILMLLFTMIVQKVSTIFEYGSLERFYIAFIMSICFIFFVILMMPSFRLQIMSVLKKVFNV